MADKARKPIGQSGFQTKIIIGTFTDTRFWSKVSGTAKEYQLSDYSDGQTNVLLPFAGAVTYPEITIEKAFTEDDADLFTKILAVNSSADYLELSIQPMYKDAYYSQTLGGMILVKGGVVKSAKLFGDIDTIGSDAAMMAVVIKPSSITSQGSIQWWLEASGTGATATKN
jgi:hypothetical protein